MAEVKESPFVVGARVAIVGTGWHEAFIEGKVAKVHKNGRFVLEGGTVSYRPHDYRKGKWVGSSADKGDHTQVIIWNEATDAELTKLANEAAAKRRWRVVSERMLCTRLPPLEVIELFEKAVAALPPPTHP